MGQERSAQPSQKEGPIIRVSSLNSARLGVFPGVLVAVCAVDT